MSKRARSCLEYHQDNSCMMMTYLSACRSGAVYSKTSDWVFDKEYLEKGISAYHNGVEDRAVLQEIMQDAKQGEVLKFSLLICQIE